MPQSRLIYTDGVNAKGIDLTQYPDEAWTWISNPPENKNDVLYNSVAAVYRVANMSADALASLPFVILRGDNEIDNSGDYQNVTGIMRNPKELLRLWRMSLFFTNKAYGFIQGNKVVNDMKYFAPTTISKVRTVGGDIVGFDRTVNNVKYEINLNDKQYYLKKVFRFLWMFRRDHTTELLASPNTEFKALMNAAGVLYNADEHIKNFYARGGIKPTLLSVQGVPTREERENIERWWDKVMKGVYKFLGKVVVAGSMEVQPIGEGVESLKDSALHREKIEDVAMAAGMPLSLLLANSANYATARVEYASWFNNSVIPWAEFIEEQLNEKVFEPMGYQFQFRPEITNEGTQEEQERAGAYAALVASNILPGVAAQMLGYELPPDYEDYSQLTEDYFAMLERKAELTSKGGDLATDISDIEIDEPKPPRPTVAPPRERVGMPKSETVELSLDQLRELDLWQQIAFRKLKRGEEMSFPFVCKQLDEGTAAIIRSRLPACKSEEDVKAAFDLTARDEFKRSELLTLAESLNRAVNVVMNKTENRHVGGFIDPSIPYFIGEAGKDEGFIMYTKDEREE
jgi:hypothetical protein